MVKIIKRRSIEFIFTLLSALVILVTLKSSRGYREITPEYEQPYKLTEVCNNYEHFINQFFSSEKVPGAAYCIVKDSLVVDMQTFGSQKITETDSINFHTKFRLASVSKGFAGVLALILEQKGILSLDDKIIDYIPGFQLKDSTSTANLTLRHTLNHTSGLVPHAYDILAEDNQAMKQILPRLKEVDIAASPGDVYGYQNVVFSLIDTVIRSINGYSYSDLLHTYIFNPLGMAHSSCTFNGLVKGGNFAYPHGISRGHYVPIRQKQTYYNVAPAAGINSSISDMSEWLIALLGHRPHVLDSALLASIANPQIYTPLKRRYTIRWGKVDNRSYSYGWRIYNYRGRDIIYHGGYVSGYRAEIAFCPQEQIGIAYLQNSPNGFASRSVPTFLNMYFNQVDSACSDYTITY